MALNPRCLVDGVFSGQVARLVGDSRSSAIAKTAVSGACWLDVEGLVGDAQADRRVHGGAGKALHHFPAEHHARLAAAFPAARHMEPGGLGENLSTRGMTEAEVCIGDVFRLGGARIQLSQPRTPCWKIDHRTGCEGVAAMIAEQGLAGWYYRVLEAGEIAAGDWLEHLERPAAAVTLAEFNQTVREPRPALAALARLAAASGLDALWVARLRQRMEWLRDNGSQA
jgi:MOSC domain-containing protein YiiM